MPPKPKKPSAAKKPSLKDVANATQALSSDTHELEAERLLREARDHSIFLRGFDAGDITSLANAISVVRFDRDEQVLAKDEEATFVGIVLSGVLAATVDGAVVGTMGAGKIVGELAFFAGGVRMADVRGAEPGFLAFVMTASLCKLFSDSPTTGVKLVRALGASSLYQLSHNPREHTPLPWGMRPEAALAEAEAWQRQHFDAEEHGLAAPDMAALIQRIRCHAFAAGELLIDRFADNGGGVCVVLRGTVHAVVSHDHSVRLRQYRAGTIVGDMGYFDASLMPFDLVGTTDGVLGCISEAAIDELAGSCPLLALSLLRHVGNSAVTDVLGGALKRLSGDAKDEDFSLPPAASDDPDSPTSQSSSPLPSASSPEALKPRRSLIHLPVGEGEQKMETFYLNKMKQQERQGGAASSFNNGEPKASPGEGKSSTVARAVEGIGGGGGGDKPAAADKTNDGSVKALKQTLKELKAELVKMAETEAHFTRLAFTKGKEIERMRSEREALMEELEESRAEIKAARTQNHAEEVNNLQRLLQSKEAEWESERQEVEEREAVLREQLRQLQTDTEASSAELVQQQSDLTAKLQTDKATLEDALAAATEQVAELQMRAAGTVVKRASEKRAVRLRESELLGMVAAKEAERNKLRLEVQKQHTAAKALACMSALKLALLRRELLRRDSGPTGMYTNERLRVLEAENRALRREAEEARQALEPLEQALAHHRASNRRSIVTVKTLEASEAPLRAELAAAHNQLKAAEERSTFFEQAHCKAEVGRAKADARAEKARMQLLAKERALGGARLHHDETRAQASALQQRLGEVEMACAPLLHPHNSTKHAPSPVQASPPAASWPREPAHPSPRTLQLPVIRSSPRSQAPTAADVSVSHSPPPGKPNASSPRRKSHQSGQVRHEHDDVTSGLHDKAIAMLHDMQVETLQVEVEKLKKELAERTMRTIKGGPVRSRG